MTPVWAVGSSAVRSIRWTCERRRQVEPGAFQHADSQDITTTTRPRPASNVRRYPVSPRAKGQDQRRDRIAQCHPPTAEVAQAGRNPSLLFSPSLLLLEAWNRDRVGGPSLFFCQESGWSVNFLCHLTSSWALAANLPESPFPAFRSQGRPPDRHQTERTWHTLGASAGIAAQGPFLFGGPASPEAGAIWRRLRSRFPRVESCCFIAATVALDRAPEIPVSGFVGPSSCGAPPCSVVLVRQPPSRLPPPVAASSGTLGCD